MTSRALQVKTSLIAVLTAITHLSSAHAAPPLRDPSKLWEPQIEEVMKISTARVLIADYDLIRKDFPEVADYDESKIDQWLIRNTAFMSKQQVSQQVTNSEIKTTGETRKVYRPREYGRALVFPVDTGGLIDAKGTGSKDPHAGFERTGLASLPEIIRLFLYEKLVSRVFKFMGKYETLPLYAILDLGFDAKKSGSHGQDVRAGMVLRRAHVRFTKGVIGDRQREDPVVLPNELQLEIELALRRFGLSSAIDLHPGQYSVHQYGDQLNIQGTAEGAVIDLDGFRVKAHFDRPIYYTYDSKGNANVSDADIAMKPDDPRFVQPDPQVSIPIELWGNTVRGDMQDNPFIWSEELSAGLAGGWATPADVRQHLHNLLDPIDEKLMHAPVCRSLFTR
jgi:hypothetical protein